MPQSTVTYNGYTFPYTRLSVREETVYAANKITVEGTAFVFQVTGHVAKNTVADMQQELTCMRARLHVPRKEFKVNWMEEGGSPQQFYGFDDDGNIAYGPQPGELSLEQFAGGRAAMYTWTVSVVVKDCPNGCTIGQPANAVLSISRSYQHRVDENGFTTRTITGRLVVDSNSVRAGKPGDWYRLTVTPAIPVNYRRTAQEFTQSEDGRELHFSFTDVEQMWTLPTPISSGNASFSVRLRELGMMADYALSGEFRASASVSKTTILQRIFDLAAAKFPINSLGFFFGDMQFDDDVYGNGIRFSICATGAAANATGQTSGQNFAIAALNALTTAPDSNGVSQQLFPYGGDGNVNSGVVARSPSLYDACTSQNNDKGELGTGSIPGGGAGSEGGSRSVNTEILTASSNGASQDHLNNPIESFHEVISYEVDNHVVLFPAKSTTANQHLVQQTATPVLTIIQCGYLRQYAQRASDTVRAPRPMNRDTLSADFVMVNAYETPASPEPVGAGKWSLYKIEWRYVMQYVRVPKDPALQEAEFKPFFPHDVRRPDADFDYLNDPPKIVRPPNSPPPTP